MKRKKKLLYILHAYKMGGGVETHCYDMCLLLKNSYDIYIITPPTKEMKESFGSIGVKHVGIAMKSKFSINSILEITKFIKKNEIDIIHTHNSRANLMGRIAGLLTKVPVITTVHASLTDIKIPLVKLYPHLLIDKILSTINTKIIAVSNYLKSKLINEHHLNKENIVTCHHGVDVVKFSLDNQLEYNLRDKYCIKPSEIVIGCVGRLSKEKGQEQLILAFSEVIGSSNDAVLLLAGDGHHKQYLQTLVKKLNIEDKVRFLGYQKDIKALLSVVDLYVCPSLTESFGISILEAMSLERCVLAHNVGGIPEIIVNEESGYLYNSNEELVEKMCYLLSEKELRRKVAKKARERVVTTFTLSNEANNLDEIYSSCIKG